jgi:hypothetical protein
VKRLVITVLFVLFLTSIALAVSVDNDYLIGYTWTPPDNAEVVDYYGVKWWGTGFGPHSGTATSDTNFVVLDVTGYPGIYQIDSVKVYGVNAHGESGPDSDRSDVVEIHILPGKPGAPYWVPDND